MKNLSIYIFIVCVYTVNAQKLPYYGQGGSRVELEPDLASVSLFLHEGCDSEQFKKDILSSVHNASLEAIPNTVFMRREPRKAQQQSTMYILRFEELESVSAYLELCKKMLNVACVKFVQRSYLAQKSKSSLITTRRIAALLKGDYTESDGAFIAEKYSLTLEGKAIDLEGWLEFSYNTNEDAFALCNRLLEEGLYFESCDPIVFCDAGLSCGNPQTFDTQWGLRNIGLNFGTPDIDIRFCDAKLLASGAGTRVAVYDDGVEISHPDLAQSGPFLNYDVVLGNSQHTPDSHGTASAGIIAARDNNIGVIGVSPQTEIACIDTRFGAGITTDQHIANGFLFAGAPANDIDVVSNSWFSEQDNTLTLAAINAIMLNGRGGLGNVVVFGSGNKGRANGENPSRLIEDIICVGAVDRCGVRPGNPVGTCETNSPVVFLSSYGPSLDVVAPGVMISTVDMQGNNGYNNGLPVNLPGTNPEFTDPNYTMRYQGTSSACPFVSGVAANILSMNPCLTQRQVGDIIERTAQKILDDILYVYNFVPDRPNGKWNEEVGHGLVDAYDALRFTKTLYVQNQIFPANDMFFANPIGEVHAGENVDITNSYEEGLVDIYSGSSVQMKSNVRIQLKKGFRARAGSTFRANISPNPVGCSGWISTKQGDVITSNKVPTNTEQPIVSAQSNDNRLSIYPNPNDGNFTLDYKRISVEKKEVIAIQVFNAIGQPVVIRYIDSQTDVDDLTLSIDNIDMVPGIYFLRLSEGNNSTNLTFLVHEY